jgi:shikimate dehydrogenase
MHNAAFAAHGIDASYELRPIEPEDVTGFFEEVRRPEWLGFGVTSPYKQVAMSHVDEVEPGASAIGAVNNGVRHDDGSLVGFNTDASGFISSLNAIGMTVTGRQTVVAGAGGAARAVVWALLDAGAETVTVANRTPERARELARDLSGFGAIVACSLDDPALTAALGVATLAVNATTMGMTTDAVAFDVAGLPEDARMPWCSIWSTSRRRLHFSGPRRSAGYGCATAWRCWCVRVRSPSSDGPASGRLPTSCGPPSRPR